MSFHSNKRRRYKHRSTQESKPNIEFKVDDELYESNYSQADKLRRVILSEFSVESHQLPPAVYKNKAKFHVLSNTWKHKAPSTHKCFYCSFKYNYASNIISMSDSVFLVLDSFKNCILEDQILIVSNSHVQNTLYLDNNAYTELRNYQKTLVYMFQQLKRSVIFVEMSTNDKHLNETDYVKVTNHCKIECYAIPTEYFEEAKCYFVKAIDEMGSTWSQHKKINVTGKTGVRGVIPQGFDYIHVDFSLSGEGLARVIEDSSKIRYTFARNIVSGILNMDLLERAFRDNEEYNNAINKFRINYKDYDWTVSG